MLQNIKDLFALSQRFNIATEDILFIDINISGINVDIDSDRVRFYVKLLFGKRNNYFFALQVRKDSDYMLKNSILYFKGECIGKVNSFEIDFCDTYYMRKNNTVLNINPKSRINCNGCTFCNTSHQKFRNILDLTKQNNLDIFFNEWMNTYKVTDLSRLYEIAIVSGCFPDEKLIVEFLLKLNEKVKSLNFNGEIFYLGSQIRSEDSLKELTKIEKFAYCLTIECFKNRERFLKKSKNIFTIEQMEEIMQKSIQLGFRTNFTYIVGLEELEILEVGFRELFEYINSFPIINIFQESQYQTGIKNNDATHIEFYLEARKIIENIFLNSTMRPQTWEVCRTLWYTSFGNEELKDK